MARSSHAHRIMMCKRLKRVRTRPELNVYLASDACGEAWVGLNARDRQSVADAIGRTWARLEAKAPLPAPHTVRVTWDQARISRLHQVARRCNYKPDDVARELAITERAARRAMTRHMPAATPLAA